MSERLQAWNRQLTEDNLSAADARRILGERANSLYALMRSDPVRALGLALPEAQIVRLRGVAVGRPELLETRGEWQGSAVAVVEDDLAHHTARTRWRIKLAGASVDVYFAGARPALTCEHQVKVSGVRLGDRIAAASATVLAATASCSTTGPQQTAVLLVSFPDNPLSPEITPALVQNTFFGSGHLTVNGYYNENSFGQVSLTGSVFGPFTLDADYDCTQTGAMEVAAIKAADPVVDWTQYSRIVIIFPDVAGCPFAGVGTVGCGTETSPARGSFTASTTWIHLSASSAFGLILTAAHEFGHSLGLLHANSLDFGSQPLGASGGVETEYGDPFSVMGTAGYVDTSGNLLLGHYNAQEKLTMGWISGTQNVATVQAGGNFKLSPIEFATSGLQAIRVQRGTGSSQFLWLESRQPGSVYDNFSLDFLGREEVFTGALIHYEDGTGLQPLRTLLLDFNPVQEPNDFRDAALRAGRTWSDPDSNLSIRVNSATPSGLDVDVFYANAASVSPTSLNFTAPSGSTTAPANMLTLGGSGPASAFTVAATSAGNWLSVGPASSGTTPANIMVNANPAGLASGNYNGAIAITVPGADNSPITVPVTLAILPAGAVGCWSFDIAFANFTPLPFSTVSDPCGGMSGNLVNAATVPGVINQALSFSGAGSYFAVGPGNPGLELRHDLTLAAWINTQNNSQKQDFVGKYDYTGQESGYLLQMLPSGVVNLHLGGNNLASGSRDAQDTTVINDGQWHHVAVTIGPGQNTAFSIDGTLSSTQPQTAASSGVNAPLYLGTSPGAFNGLPFTGSLDQVQVYNRRLSADEIATLAGAAGPFINSVSVVNAPFQGAAFNLVIHGRGFVQGATVVDPDEPDTNPGLKLLPTTFVSSTQLTVAVPRDLTMNPGTLRLQVFNSYPAGPSSNIESVTVNPLFPVITSLSPASVNAGSPGFVLTVNGSNFESPCPQCQGVNPGAIVQWNGVGLATTFVSSSQLTAAVPAGLLVSPGTASVTVVNQGNVSSGPVIFNIVNPTPLSMSCLPAAGPTNTGIAFSTTCTASGGRPPYNWSISAGGLPAGISLSASTGASVTISGTPTTPEDYSFTVTATDSTAPPNQASQSFSGLITGTAPPPSALAGCWTFDTITGNQVPDCSGNGLTGTLFSATPVPGVVNQALSFSGAGSYVVIPDSAGLELTHDLTLATWVRTTNTTQKQDLVSKYDFTALEYGYILQTLPSGVVNLRVGGNNLLSGSRDVQDTTPINDGQFHHVAVVITLGRSVQFFIDGRLSSVQPLLTAPARNTALLYFGALPVPYNGLPFVGVLDEVMIFSRALSAAEVLALVGGPGPVITSLSPATTPQGTLITLTVNGSGFASGAVVVNPDVPPTAPRAARVWPTTFVNSTQLTAAVPLDFTLANGTVRVQVFNRFPIPPGSNIASFTVTPLVPAITSLSQNSAVAGGPAFNLTVNGTNFVTPGGGVLEILYGASVHWNGTNLLGDPFLSSSTRVIVSVPANLIATPGTASITVVNPGGTTSAPMTFTITNGVSSLTPAGHWTFDTADINGNQLADRSGNGLTGTIVNATPVAQGRVNQALSFSGAGSYVVVPNSASLDLTHDLTLAAWVQTTNNSQTQDFISKYDFTASETGYMLQMLPTGTVNLHVGGNNLLSGSRDVHDSTVINDGQWHHVAVVITLGQTVSFYIDGVLKSTQPMATVSSGTSMPLYLGTLPGAYLGQPFVGALDEVWIFNSAITAAQVAILAAGGS